MLTNSQMRSGRFLKLHNGRKLLARMTASWNAGGFVLIATYLRCTKVSAKNRNFVKMDASGSLYVSRGLRWDCIDGCSFQFTKI